MNHDKTPTGHLAAFITILIWGTTFISTKVLLKTFSPVEILFIRFVMGYLALWLVCPRTLKLDSRRQEPLFMAAGLCGITMYYLLENIALTFTLASNVGVIISIAPFFTAILSCLFLGGTRPGRQFFIGFLLAMAGIFLLSFGSSSLSINPMGDILAVAAAIIWAVYSTLTKKIIPIPKEHHSTLLPNYPSLLPCTIVLHIFELLPLRVLRPLQPEWSCLSIR